MLPHARVEAELAGFLRVDPACVAAVSSGTAALHLALECLCLPPGSSVLTCDFNMVAAPRAIILAGHTPAFADCTENLLLDLDAADYALSAGGVRAVLAPHIYGRRVDMDELHALAAKHSPCAAVEDLAELHGFVPHPETAAAATSFYRNKVVAGWEGGAVIFRDPAHAALARELRCLGFTAEHDFLHIARGHNYRLADPLAEKILESLAGYAGNLLERRLAERWYDKYCPEAWRMPPRACPWVHDVRIPGLTRQRQKAIVKALNAEGTQARMSFAPMHAQEEFKDCWRVGGKVADKASQEVFYLPLTPGEVTEAKARRAFEVIRGVLGEENGKPGA